jgi:hypothetical protein
VYEHCSSAACAIFWLTLGLLAWGVMHMRRKIVSLHFRDGFSYTRETAAMLPRLEFYVLRAAAHVTEYANWGMARA